MCFEGLPGDAGRFLMAAPLTLSCFLEFGLPNGSGSLKAERRNCCTGRTEKIFQQRDGRNRPASNTVNARSDP